MNKKVCDHRDDQWRDLGNTCYQALHQRGIECTLTDKGFLEQIQTESLEIFRDYDKVLPIYTIHIGNKRLVELSLCGTMPPQTRGGFVYPPIIFDTVPDNNDRIMKFDISEARLFGIVHLNADPGHIFISPIDIASKALRIFHHTSYEAVGLDEFCKDHSSVCDDLELAESILQPSFFSMVATLENPYIETRDSLLVVGLKQMINEEQALVLATFVQAVASAF